MNQLKLCAMLAVSLGFFFWAVGLDRGVALKHQVDILELDETSNHPGRVGSFFSPLSNRKAMAYSSTHHVPHLFPRHHAVRSPEDAPRVLGAFDGSQQQRAMLKKIDKKTKGVKIAKTKGAKIAKTKGAKDSKTKGAKKGNMNTDINSCDHDPCDHGTCENVVGGYICRCEQGWQGEECDVDFDECSSADTNSCDDQSEVCSNTAGSFLCLCADGYSPNDNTCELASVDIDTSILSSFMVPGILSVIDHALGEFEIVEATGDVAGTNSVKSDLCPDIGLMTFSINNDENKFELSGTLDGSASAVRVFRENGFPVAEASADEVTGRFSLTILDALPVLSTFLITPLAREGELNTGNRTRHLVGESEGNMKFPALSMINCQNSCGPPLTLTLSWDGPTSDIDLHIYEPLVNEKVFFGRKEGLYGILDYDDIDGFGPEHYIAHEVVSGEYAAQVNAHSVNNDTHVVWILKAHSGGRLLWSEKGTFDGSTELSHVIFFTVEPVQCSCDDDTGDRSMRRDLHETEDQLHVHCPEVRHPTKPAEVTMKAKAYYSGPMFNDWKCCDGDSFCIPWFERKCADEPDPSLFFTPKCALYDKVIFGDLDTLLAVVNVMWFPTAVEMSKRQPETFMNEWNSKMKELKNGDAETGREWIINNVVCSCFVENKMYDAFTNVMSGIELHNVFMDLKTMQLTSNPLLDLENYKLTMGKALGSAGSVEDFIVNYHLDSIRTQMVQLAIYD